LKDENARRSIIIMEMLQFCLLFNDVQKLPTGVLLYNDLLLLCQAFAGNQHNIYTRRQLARIYICALTVVCLRKYALPDGVVYIDL
jgi:hypothetical protein